MRSSRAKTPRDRTSSHSSPVTCSTRMLERRDRLVEDPKTVAEAPDPTDTIALGVFPDSNYKRASRFATPHREPVKPADSLLQSVRVDRHVKVDDDFGNLEVSAPPPHSGRI